MPSQTSLDCGHTVTFQNSMNHKSPQNNSSTYRDYQDESNDRPMTIIPEEDRDQESSQIKITTS